MGLGFRVLMGFRASAQGSGLSMQWQALRVHVLSIWVLRALVIVVIVQVLGKYMIIRYLDP